MPDLPDDDLFQIAFENAAIGMALVALDGRWLRVNRSICQIVGYGEAELLNITFQEITHPDDLDLDLSYVRMLAAGEIQSYQMEKRYRHKLGHDVWVLLCVVLARTEEGAPRFFVSQIQDITLRKTTALALENSLREQQRLYRELEDSAALLSRMRQGLLTICAWTKRIQHDGHWISVDEFLSKQLGFQLTHGISEEGARQFLSGQDGEPSLFDLSEATGFPTAKKDGHLPKG